MGALQSLFGCHFFIFHSNYWIFYNVGAFFTISRLFFFRKKSQKIAFFGVLMGFRESYMTNKNKKKNYPIFVVLNSPMNGSKWIIEKKLESVVCSKIWTLSEANNLKQGPFLFIWGPKYSHEKSFTFLSPLKHLDIHLR